MFYRELLAKFYDINFYSSCYFLYDKGKPVPWGNEPTDFNMYPVAELYLEIDPMSGFFKNSNVKPYSWIYIECIKEKLKEIYLQKIMEEISNLQPQKCIEQKKENSIKIQKPRICQ